MSTFTTNNNTRRTKRGRMTNANHIGLQSNISLIENNSIPVGRKPLLVETTIGSHNSKGLVIVGGSVGQDFNQPNNPDERDIPLGTSSVGGVGVTGDTLANPPYPITFIGPGYMKFQNEVSIPSIRGDVQLNGNLKVIGTLESESNILPTDQGAPGEFLSTDGNDVLSWTAVTSPLPEIDGTAGQVLSTDGAGTLSWVTVDAPRVTGSVGQTTSKTTTITGANAQDLVINVSTVGSINAHDMVSFTLENSFIPALGGQFSATLQVSSFGPTPANLSVMLGAYSAGQILIHICNNDSVTSPSTNAIKIFFSVVYP